MSRQFSVRPTAATAGTGRRTQVATRRRNIEIAVTDTPFPEHRTDLGVQHFELKSMDIGARLRQARESHGLTLREVGDITKLSMMTLQRIERGELNALPGGILIRGYLRAYAAVVGLVPEEVVGEYLAASATERAGESPAATPPPERRYFRSTIVILAVAVAAAAVAYFWQTWPGTRIEGSPAAEAASEGGSPFKDAAGSDAVTTAAHASRLTLDLQAAGMCWISISVDGKRAIYRVFQPGDRASVSAEDELVLRVGDPGAFVYTLNGDQGRQLGESGQPITVTITRENYEMYLESQQADAGSAKLT